MKYAIDKDNNSIPFNKDGLAIVDERIIALQCRECGGAIYTTTCSTPGCKNVPKEVVFNININEIVIK